MSYRIRVYTRPDWYAPAIIRNTEIRFGGRSLYPTAIYQLNSAGGSAAGTVGGAVAGAVLAGGLGALVGAMAGGGGGRMGFVIETAGGPKLFCSCRASEFPGIYMLVDKLIQQPRPVGWRSQESRKASKFNWFLALILGPFYLMRYGAVHFMLGLFLTLATLGWSWPALWLLSLFFERRDPRQTHFG